MADEKELKVAIRKSGELVKDLAEPLQVAALPVVLAHLLSGAEVLKTEDVGGTSAAKKPAARGRTGTLPAAHDVKSGSNIERVAWAVVTLSSRGTPATVEAIRGCIRSDLGATPPSGSNTSTYLQRMTPQYVTRAQVGRGYVYAPTDDVLEVFKSDENE
jgi:hypothetical protein